MLRHDEVPSDPQQRRPMGELVDRRLGRTRHRTAALVSMAVLLAGVVAVVASVSGLGRTLGYGAFSLAFFLYLYFGSRVGPRRLQRMRTALAPPAANHEAHDAGHPAA